MEQQLILDRYRPLEDLGEGGSGAVVLAWDTRMQRRVAVKRMWLPLDSTGSPIVRPPGLTEARTAAMLNHPSIVTVHDFETDADEAYLIMEHIDGASLEAVLDDLDDVLDLDEMAAVFSAVADALCFAHENGVLHLDIKPANILINRDGRVKVADFGMAAISTAMGHGRSAGGTLGYMPVEQLEGMPVNEATDVWAFAALTYECLTGTNPFDADTIEAAIARLETLPTPVPSGIERSLPEEIDDVLLAALGLHPLDRYRTVAEFADALEPYLGDERAGQQSLADLVAARTVDDEQDTEHAPGLYELGLWDRLGGGAGKVLLGVVAAVECGWLAWAGLSWTHLDRLGVLAAVALIVLAGAIAPALGAALGVAALCVGLFVTGNWMLGLLVTLGGGVWWWFAARTNPGAAVIPLSAPILGVIQLAPVTPLLAGFWLPTLPAALAGLVGGVLAMLASAASFAAEPYIAVDPLVFVDLGRAPLVALAVRHAFLSPVTYIALAGWPLSAALMSWFCARSTRLWAMIGAVLSSVVFGGAYVLADLAGAAMGGGSAWITAGMSVSVTASITMVLLVAALGAPTRPEEDCEPQ